MKLKLFLTLPILATLSVLFICGSAVYFKCFHKPKVDVVMWEEIIEFHQKAFDIVLKIENENLIFKNTVIELDSIKK